jgi:hypothetical protein
MFAAACGDDAAGGVRVLDSGASPAEGAGGDAASITPGDTGPASCDLSGIWIARMNGETSALGPQYPNTWYYYEFTQQGAELTVARHMDCGIEVRGTATVQLTPATQMALIQHNIQTGRRGSVTAQGDGTCALEIERFWSVRGVDEDRYAPKPRNSAAALATVQAENPLPPKEQPTLTADWDGDGQPGISWQISGIVTGSRASAQRDWTRYFTAPGYTLRAAGDFRQDVVIRAEFEVQEVVYTSSGLGLDQLAQVNAAAEHTLTMRFLGRTRDDPRAQALLKASDFDTCVALREALPSVRGLR